MSLLIFPELMSCDIYYDGFGFSIGDIAAIGNFAWTVYKSCKSAGEEFRSITQYVNILQTELRELSDEASSPTSLLHSCTKGQRDELRAIIKACKVDLKELEKVLVKYKSLNTVDPRKRDRFRFTTDKQIEMKAKLSTHAERLTLFLTHLNAGALGRIEATQAMHTGSFDDIKAKLEAIHEDVRAGRKDPTLLSDMDDWGTLEQELVDDNITEVDVELNKDLIGDWLKQMRGEVESAKSPVANSRGRYQARVEDAEDEENGKMNMDNTGEPNSPSQELNVSRSSTPNTVVHDTPPRPDDDSSFSESSRERRHKASEEVNPSSDKATRDRGSMPRSDYDRDADLDDGGKYYVSPPSRSYPSREYIHSKQDEFLQASGRPNRSSSDPEVERAYPGYSQTPLSSQHSKTPDFGRDQFTHRTRSNRDRGDEYHDQNLSGREEYSFRYNVEPPNSGRGVPYQESGFQKKEPTKPLTDWKRPEYAKARDKDGRRERSSRYPATFEDWETDPTRSDRKKSRDREERRTYRDIRDPESDDSDEKRYHGQQARRKYGPYASEPRRGVRNGAGVDQHGTTYFRTDQHESPSTSGHHTSTEHSASGFQNDVFAEFLRQEKEENFSELEVTIVEKPLPVTLEEVFNGATKKMKIKRKTFDTVTGTTSTMDRILEVPLKRGLRAGSKIKFSDVGDQTENGRQDLHFVIQEQEHPLFRRENDDLRYTHTVSVKELLCGLYAKIRSIDGNYVHFSQPGPLQADHVERIAGWGMPKSKAPHERGDLLIDLKVLSPSSLTEDQKAALRSILDECD